MTRFKMQTMTMRLRDLRLAARCALALVLAIAAIFPFAASSSQQDPHAPQSLLFFEALGGSLEISAPILDSLGSRSLYVPLGLGFFSEDESLLHPARALPPPPFSTGKSDPDARESLKSETDEKSASSALKAALTKPTFAPKKGVPEKGAPETVAPEKNAGPGVVADPDRGALDRNASSRGVEEAKENDADSKGPRRADAPVDKTPTTKTRTAKVPPLNAETPQAAQAAQAAKTAKTAKAPQAKSEEEAEEAVEIFISNAELPVRAAFRKQRKRIRGLREAVKSHPRDLICLAEALYFEARSEHIDGRIAVAHVVFNRVAHKAFPNDVCSVVYQNSHRRHRCQFSFACDGLAETPHERESWRENYRLAQELFAGRKKRPYHFHGATHFHAHYVNPVWMKSLERIKRIGTHIFYRMPHPHARRNDRNDRHASREAVPPSASLP